MKTLKEILEALKGKKTYITACLLSFYALLKAFNIINFTADQDVAVLALLGSLLGISLRSAIK